MAFALPQSPRQRAAIALLAYFLLAFLGFLPGSLQLLTGWVTWFEDPSNAYRIWWFSEVIYGRNGGSIWFMPDLLYPVGLRTMQTSNGLLKELLAALLGGGSVPWLAMNLIAFTTPITVAFTAFLVLRRLLHGAFAPALVGGWFSAWGGYFVGIYSSPWMASTEGLIAFLGLMLLMRERATPHRALCAGLAAALAVWLQAQMMVYLATFSLVFLADRWLRRDFPAMGYIFLSGGVAILLTAPLLYQIGAAYDWRLSAMAGDNPELDYNLFRSTILSFVLAPESHLHWQDPVYNLFGWFTTWLREDLGLTLRLDRGSYLGWVVIVLAWIGWRTRHRHTGFLAASALFFLLLSLGPSITLGIDSPKPPPRTDQDVIANLQGQQRLGIPGPFLVLKELPPFNSLRTPMRFSMGAQLCLGMLAAYGALHLLRRRKLRSVRGARLLLILAALLLHLHDMRWPMSFAHAQYSPFYEVLANDREKYMVLDIPYFRGNHQYMHYAAYHQKRTPWGFGSRVPQHTFSEVETQFPFPMINVVDFRAWPRDYAPFAQNLVKHDVRYLILHKKYFEHDLRMASNYRRVLALIESPATWRAQTAIRPPRLVHDDELIRVYQIQRLDDSPQIPDADR